MSFTINGTTGINLATQPLTGALPDANAPSGSVIQVVQGTYGTATTTSATSFTSTGLTASITPSSSTSKILIIASLAVDTSSNGEQAYFAVYRNSSTNLSGTVNGFGNAYATSSRVIGMLATSYLDSPATTSSTTYTVYVRSNGSNIIAFQGNSPAYITLMEIAA